MAIKAVTVAGLIEALRKMPEDVVVSLEGCDCYGYASGDVTLDDAPLDAFDADDTGHPAGTRLVSIKRVP